MAVQKYNGVNEKLSPANMKIVISCLQNHGKEDGIYPLKEIAKHKTRIRDLL